MTATASTHDSDVDLLCGTPWRGNWIWPTAPSGEISAVGCVQPTAEEEHALFRKSFDLRAVPATAPARFTADSRYVLYVNGVEVVRGPVRSQPRRLRYDYLDLASYLRPGRNVIAAAVRWYGRDTAYYMLPVPNEGLGRNGFFVAEVDLGEDRWLVSDDSWRCTLSPAWHTGEDAATYDLYEGLPVEAVDARLLPADWIAADFDDGAWPNAALLAAKHAGGHASTRPPGDPYGALLPRPIALLEDTVLSPDSVRTATLPVVVDTSVWSPLRRLQQCIDAGALKRASVAGQLPAELALGPGDTGVVVVDFGRIVSGLVQVEFDGPAGVQIDLVYLEDELGSPPGHGSGSRYITRGHADTFETSDPYGLRYLYLLVSGPTEGTSIRSVRVREQLSPWPGSSRFECSDSGLDAIYRAGVRTVRLCAPDAYVDCPTREQRAWVGDGVVHQMVTLATNDDWRMAWWYLELGDSPRSDGILPMSVVGDLEAGNGYTIPDWALHWIHGMHNMYMSTGDRARIKAFMPTAERILRWYEPYQDAQGVLNDVTEWNLVDWSSIHVEAQSSVLTALWARGLAEFSEMANWLDERGSAAWADGLWSAAQAGFEIFWDADRELYVDHVVGGARRPAVSHAALATAIVSGLAPRARWAAIVDAMIDEDRTVVRSWTGGAGDYDYDKEREQISTGVRPIDWDVSREIVLAEPFFSYVVHDAVAAAGFADRLSQLLQRWGQFLTSGYDTLGECWGWGTHVHGWSCTPTRDLIGYVLGIRPDLPGYERARVAPRLGPLERAQGSAPTPHGPIEVRVDADAVTVHSPVPVVLDLGNADIHELAAGTSRTPRPAANANSAAIQPRR